mgnify:CR=1 FL=1
MIDDETRAIYGRAKVELRKRLRALRATTPESACAERSARIVSSLVAMPAIESASRVALFWPIVARHEVDLRVLDASLRARGVTLAYPSIDPETRDMTFRVTARREDLEERGFGFEEPAQGAPVIEALDVIIVPQRHRRGRALRSLCGRPRGHRLGYGAGFYDRTLPHWSPPALKVAVVFDYQLLVELPFTETDVAMDWIVTDTRVFQAENGP